MPEYFLYYIPETQLFKIIEEGKTLLGKGKDNDIFIASHKDIKQYIFKQTFDEKNIKLLYAAFTSLNDF